MAHRNCVPYSFPSRQPPPPLDIPSACSHGDVDFVLLLMIRHSYTQRYCDAAERKTQKARRGAQRSAKYAHGEQRRR